MLHFPADLYTQMLDHLRHELPNEGCGLIAFKGDRPVKIFPGTNVLASRTRYRMDDAEVISAVDEMEANGWWLGAIYHSHPASPPQPSSTDLREANWPNAIMIIVSLSSTEPDVHAFRVDGDRYQSIRIEVEAAPASRVASWKDVLRRALRWREIPDSQGSLPATAGGESQANTPWQAARRTTIGVLGGMGPAATADLYSKLIQLTPAKHDQEHIPVVIYADPRVPDRTEALLEGGDDPTPWLVHGAQQLASAGADFVIIPCNTAHAFIDRVRAEVNIEILSMIDIAALEIKRCYPDARSVGLLATSGTISAGIYQQALRERGLATIIPDDELQRRNVMSAIGAVKANDLDQSVTGRLAEAGEVLVERGAQVVLAACTEIPVVLTAGDLSVPLVDATEALARYAVREAQRRDGFALPSDEQKRHELETA